ncbi:glycosyltransferase family 4 protein [Ottowia testudinis]|uniref:Glycosyltransferase family 4 protein n=1 Tax=Ottowia testudinis TaxID=2816950 RepID=A0A975CH87_9BURK|nr:glycosyltransferase family 4 protein [Ottowia testudinis]QTD45041.1 glycosyltransferase family 4 protein [Ottowia testudinis]
MALLIWHRARQVRDLIRRDGIIRTLGMIWQRMRHGPGQWRLQDVLAHYDFVRPGILKLQPGRIESNSLVWFVPDFNIGSGGHLNIFRTIWYLEKMGYTSNIVIVRPVMHQDSETARADIIEHFFPLRASVYMGLAHVPPSEFAVATSWETAYPVRALAGPVRKLYFVQDYEPYFYSVGTESVLAENTYRFGFFGITAGEWLAKKLAQEYGMHTHAVGFGVELDRYRRLPRREPGIRRVFFYARPPTPRRAFELGLLVLNEVARRRPDTQFVLAGWDTSSYQIPFPHLACGTVVLDDLPDLYSQCDVALVLSLTNLSLLPLELMACGCAVVSNRGECVQWLLTDEVAVLTLASPDALADAVCDLLDDDERRQALTERAEVFARSQTWDVVARAFERGLHAARKEG